MRRADNWRSFANNGICQPDSVRRRAILNFLVQCPRDRPSFSHHCHRVGNLVGECGSCRVLLCASVESRISGAGRPISSAFGTPLSGTSVGKPSPSTTLSGRLTSTVRSRWVDAWGEDQVLASGKSDVDRLRRVRRFGDEETLDRDRRTGGRPIGPGCALGVTT
jgi:hypothetical protein